MYTGFVPKLSTISSTIICAAYIWRTTHVLKQTFQRPSQVPRVEGTGHALQAQHASTCLILRVSGGQAYMQRYDRQERLWSREGQEGLTSGHVWALGKSLAMVETLKNLALAGVGKLTLTMHRLPENSFFDFEGGELEDQLHVMNSNMCIEYADRPTSPVDLVVTTRTHDRPALGSEKVPIIVIGCHEMSGFVEIQPNEHTIPILQPHPASGLIDLRFKPQEVWPEYKKYCDKFDLDTLGETEHSHVPFCVLLVKAIAEECNNPETKIREMLAKMQRYPNEDNFREAVGHLWRLKRPTIPEGVEQLIAFAQSSELSEQDSKEPFWVLVKALDKFIHANGCLPLSGHIPDMVSTSNNYLELKRVYKSKANADALELAGYAEREIAHSYVKIFSENSRFIRALVPLPEDNNDNDDHDDSGARRSEESSQTARLHELKSGEQKAAVPVAAMIGGIAAQEAMKLLMGQFTPIIGALLYDGNTQETSIVKSTMRIIN